MRIAFVIMILKKRKLYISKLIKKKKQLMIWNLKTLKSLFWKKKENKNIIKCL